MYESIDQVYVEWLFKRANSLRTQISGHAALLLHGKKPHVDQKRISIQIHEWDSELISIEVELAEIAKEVWTQDEISILQ